MGDEKWRASLNVARQTVLVVFLLMLCPLFAASFVFQPLLAQSTLGFTTYKFAIQNTEGYNQGGFFAAGRFWTWYTNGTFEMMTSSVDGLNWGPSVVLLAHSGTTEFAGTFDGTYFHYVSPNYGVEGHVVYRRGLPNSDGTITWSAPQQTVLICGTGIYACDDAAIAVDTGGYAWISYSTPYSDCSGCLPSYPYITKDANNDGTWTTASGFPVKLSNTRSGGEVGIGDWGETIIPLTNQKVYVLYGHGETYVNGTGSAPIFGDLYSSGEFGPQENATSSFLFANMMFSSAVAVGDDVYLVFLTKTQQNNLNVVFVKRTGSSGQWSSESIIYPSITTVPNGTSLSGVPAVALSRDDKGNLFLFWMGNPTPNHIYYMKYDAALSSWDASPTDWITESAITDNRDIMVYYQGALGVTYETGNTGPYSIRFALLNPSTTTTTSSTATTGSSTSASTSSITPTTTSTLSTTSTSFTSQTSSVTTSLTTSSVSTAAATTLAPTTLSPVITGTISTTVTTTGSPQRTFTTTSTQILSTSTSTSQTTSSTFTTTIQTLLTTSTASSTATTGSTSFTTTTSAGTVTVTQTDTHTNLITAIVQVLHELVHKIIQVFRGTFRIVKTPLGRRVHRVTVVKA